MPNIGYDAVALWEKWCRLNMRIEDTFICFFFVMIKAQHYKKTVIFEYVYACVRV